MSKFTSPLNNIKVASPCSANWNEMIGSERQRHCGDCKLNVYNLSGMSKQEAENLLMNAEGRLCVRFYRRADGTILTKDCPVGWRAIKQRVSKTAAAFASLIFAAIGGIGLSNYFAKESDRQHTMGTMVSVNENVVMGKIAVTENSNIDEKPTMGEMVSYMGMASNIKIDKRQMTIRHKR